jgi:hypothetical protein
MAGIRTRTAMHGQGRRRMEPFFGNCFYTWSEGIPTLTHVIAKPTDQFPIFPQDTRLLTLSGFRACCRT